MQAEAYHKEREDAGSDSVHASTALLQMDFSENYTCMVAYDCHKEFLLFVNKNKKKTVLNLKKLENSNENNIKANQISKQNKTRIK